MSRYQLMFDRLERKQRGAFVPFVTLGDPTLETSFSIIKSMIDAGVDCLELGFPYSDPIADGPVIQAASIRALEAGVTIDDCFDLLVRIRDYDIDIPIGILTYSNLIFARGINQFYKEVSSIGVDSVLVADLPIKESPPFYHAAIQHDIAPIFIVPPNITEAGLAHIAKHSHGYTYLLSRAGVTGIETQAKMPTEYLMKKLSEYRSAPALLGFGISEPLHVEDAINAGAAGVIVGSAIVKRIAEHLDNPESMVIELNHYIKTMMSATYCKSQELI
jgi:tryptophan synthase alpha chain